MASQKPNSPPHPPPPPLSIVKKCFNFIKKYIDSVHEKITFLTAIWLPHCQLWAIIEGTASLIRC